MNKPSFIIIGGHRCGTTFLYDCICAHSKIKKAKKKELQYYDYFFDKGLGWYKSQFPPYHITGEATVNYFYFPSIADKIKKDFPNILIIFLYRDPTNRSYSHYIRERRIKEENIKVFQKEIDLFDPNFPYRYIEHPIITKSLYSNYINNWLKVFPNMVVIKSEEMFKNTQKHLNIIFNSIGLEKEIIDLKMVEEEIDKNKYKNSYRPMHPNTIKRLNSFFEKYNNELKAILSKWRKSYAQ